VGPSTEPLLSGTYPPESPGLPRGRNSLPQDQTRDAQRRRLLRAVIATVAEQGYAETTVADIVKQARVSRTVFYEHFTDKRECFLAAAVAGGTLLQTKLTVPAETDAPLQGVREGVHAYLELCASEPEYTRCLLLELPAVGGPALQVRRAGYDKLARLIRGLHERIRKLDPELPPAPHMAYTAATGIVSELVITYIVADTIDRLPDLEDTIVTLLLRLFALPTPDPSAADSPCEAKIPLSVR
jgi:AcrR family transcriptional regulator